MKRAGHRFVTIPIPGRDRSFIRDLSVTFSGRYPFVIPLILDGDYALVPLAAGSCLRYRAC
jgi:hypothetical protein